MTNGGFHVTLEIDRQLGRRIVQARETLHMTPETVAAKIEVSFSDYKKIEAGSVRIRALYMARLSRVLKQPLRWFYEGLPGQTKFEGSTRLGKSV